MMTGDLELLRDYARNISEEAFAVLVKRHVNLTYSAAPAGADDEQREPDPLKLLLGVAQAQQRIDSDSLELLLSTDQLRNGRKHTTKSRIAVQFDGPRRRCEARQREYAYIPLVNDDSPEAKESIRQADSMDKEAAVRAGLLTGFEAHEITASDGAALVRYREHEGQQGSTTVDDPEKGSANIAPLLPFRSRCLPIASLRAPTNSANK